MISRVWLINGILAIAIVLCLVNIWDVWQSDARILPDSRPAAGDIKTGRMLKKDRLKEVSPESAYRLVVDRNLFSPDRMPPQEEPDVPEAKVDEEVRISGEKVELYGVIILDEYKKALTNDPVNRDNRFKWVREGEKIGNLLVREIQADNIELSGDGKIYRILLYDRQKGRKTADTKIRGSSAPEAQPEIISAGAKPPSVKKTPSASKVNASAASDDEYVIVDTPFGPMKKRKR